MEGGSGAANGAFGGDLVLSLEPASQLIDEGDRREDFSPSLLPKSMDLRDVFDLGIGGSYDGFVSTNDSSSGFVGLEFDGLVAGAGETSAELSAEQTASRRYDADLLGLDLDPVAPSESAVGQTADDFWGLLSRNSPDAMFGPNDSDPWGPVAAGDPAAANLERASRHFLGLSLVEPPSAVGAGFSDAASTEPSLGLEFDFLPRDEAATDTRARPGSAGDASAEELTEVSQLSELTNTDFPAASAFTASDDLLSSSSSLGLDEDLDERSATRPPSDLGFEILPLDDAEPEGGPDADGSLGENDNGSNNDDGRGTGGAEAGWDGGEAIARRGSADDALGLSCRAVTRVNAGDGTSDDAALLWQHPPLPGDPVPGLDFARTPTDGNDDDVEELPFPDTERATGDGGPETTGGDWTSGDWSERAADLSWNGLAEENVNIGLAEPAGRAASDDVPAGSGPDPFAFSDGPLVDPGSFRSLGSDAERTEGRDIVTAADAEEGGGDAGIGSRTGADDAPAPGAGHMEEVGEGNGATNAGPLSRPAAAALSGEPPDGGSPFGDAAPRDDAADDPPPYPDEDDSDSAGDDDAAAPSRRSAPDAGSPRQTGGAASPPGDLSPRGFPGTTSAPLVDAAATLAPGQLFPIPEDDGDEEAAELEEGDAPAARPLASKAEASFGPVGATLARLGAAAGTLGAAPRDARPPEPSPLLREDDGTSSELLFASDVKGEEVEQEGEQVGPTSDFEEGKQEQQGEKARREEWRQREEKVKKVEDCGDEVARMSVLEEEREEEEEVEQEETMEMEEKVEVKEVEVEREENVQQEEKEQNDGDEVTQASAFEEEKQKQESQEDQEEKVEREEPVKKVEKQEKPENDGDEVARMSVLEEEHEEEMEKENDGDKVTRASGFEEPEDGGGYVDLSSEPEKEDGVGLVDWSVELEEASSTSGEGLARAMETEPLFGLAEARPLGATARNDDGLSSSGLGDLEPPVPSEEEEGEEREEGVAADSEEALDASGEELAKAAGSGGAGWDALASSGLGDLVPPFPSEEESVGATGSEEALDESGEELAGAVGSGGGACRDTLASSGLGELELSFPNDEEEREGREDGGATGSEEALDTSGKELAGAAGSGGAGRDALSSSGLGELELPSLDAISPVAPDSTSGGSSSEDRESGFSSPCLPERWKGTPQRCVSHAGPSEEEHFEDYGEGDEIDFVSEPHGDRQGGAFLDAPPGSVPTSPSERSQRRWLGLFPPSPGLALYCSQCSRRVDLLRQLDARLRHLEAHSPNRRISTNAFARQLLNHSSLSSTAGSTEELDTDSLELGGPDIAEQMSILEKKVLDLENDTVANCDLQSKLKQENLHLVHRIHALEEQLKDTEVRGEERLEEDARRHREQTTRLTREKNAQMETLASRLLLLEEENEAFQSTVPRLKTQIEKLEEEKTRLEERLEDLVLRVKDEMDLSKKLSDKMKRDRHEFQKEREATQELIEDLRRELEHLQLFRLEMERGGRGRSASSGLQEYNTRTREAELEQEVRRVKMENRKLKESNEELNGQIISLSLQEAKNLFSAATKSHSLAAEIDSASRDELMVAFKELEDMNAHLRQYMDKIILAILDHNPSILEIKS